jgi:hypothetical protein
MKSEYIRIQKNAVVSYLMLLLQCPGEITEILHEDIEQSNRDSSWILLEYKSKLCRYMDLIRFIYLLLHKLKKLL